MPQPRTGEQSESFQVEPGNHGSEIAYLRLDIVLRELTLGESKAPWIETDQAYTLRQPLVPPGELWYLPLVFDVAERVRRADDQRRSFA